MHVYCRKRATWENTEQSHAEGDYNIHHLQPPRLERAAHIPFYSGR